MKFTKMVALIAIVGLAANASAYTSDGTLRRSYEVAQADQAIAPDAGTATATSTTTTSASSKEVILNINNNTNVQPQAQPAAQQPVTTVEAPPAAESKAEILRREREKAEVQTEQKIVEKLEDSRLQEERARADRLFGNKLDPQTAPKQEQQQPPVAVVPAPAPVVVTPAPVVQEKEKQEKTAGPTQVTIEKVEIVQPAAPAPIEKPARYSAEGENSASIDQAEYAPEYKTRYYVSGQVGNSSYAASNVQSNYGLGVAVGAFVDEHWALELGYLYSNHDVTDIWSAPVYHNLAQSEFSGAAKYYFLTGKLRPYAGGSVSYIYRNYTDRIQSGYAWMYNPSTNSASTNAVNVGLLTGLDFAINPQFIVGANLAYSFNVATTSSMNNYEYGLPDGTQQLEKISFWTYTVGAKFLF